ncbi:hypothetical protein DFJ74DRAFT_700925 [Hyaloraphidium curvatum]|nr:hypothetical protein DFJ74DRAFT_700925 [Hyaloraphidium curvatum]
MTTSLPAYLLNRLDPNYVFMANAVAEGIFPFLNLFLGSKDGSPVLFPYLVPNPDPGYPSTSQALLLSDLWSMGMVCFAGYVSYNAFDAPDTEKTKWAVAFGAAMYHLFLLVKAVVGPTWVGPYLPSTGIAYSDYSEEYLRWGTIVIHGLLLAGFAFWLIRTNERHYPRKRVVGLTQEAIEEEERRRQAEQEAEATITTPGAQALAASETPRKRR